MKKSRRKKRGRRIFLSIFAVLLAVAAGFGIYLSLYKPSPDDTLPFSDPEGEYSPEADQYNFLFIGRDRSDALADVIMIVHFDTREGSLSLMQLPRDTYLETDAHSLKINAAYATFYRQAKDEGERKPELEAARLLSDALERTMCVSLHYTVVMDLEGFAAVVDILAPDGIIVDVPLDMDYEDPEQDLAIHLKAGVNVLHGAEAEQFIRFRSGYALADVGRVDAQKIFLAAMIAQLKEAMSGIGIPEITALTTEVLTHVKTDVSLLDAIYFARKALGLDLEKVAMMTLPGEASRDGGGSWYYQANRDDTLTMINLYFNTLDLDIAERLFDADYALTDEKDSLLPSIYFDESGRYAKVYTAADVKENSIDIKPKSP